MQVREVVFLGKETGAAVVTALDDVQREAVQMSARAAGHWGCVRGLAVEVKNGTCAYDKGTKVPRSEVFA